MHQMIDILVLNYNDSSTTISFANSVKDFSNIGHILIVDNNSTDNSVEKIKEITSEKVLLIQCEQNGGYGSGNNFGIKYLYKNFRSEFILLSNPDVIVAKEVLVKLEEFLRTHLDYVIASSFMCNPKGVHQCNTAFRIPSKWEDRIFKGLGYYKTADHAASYF